MFYEKINDYHPLWEEICIRFYFFLLFKQINLQV